VKETFDRDGIVFPVRVLTDAEVERYRTDVTRTMSDCGSDRRLDQLHLFFHWAYELATHRVIVDAVRQILGDDVLVWGSLVLSKPPHDESFVAWHQDGHYADFLGDAPALSAWIALTDSSVHSGCMRVVPGSQRVKLEHAVTAAPLNMLSHGQEIAAEVNETDAVDVVLRPGEMSLHHVDIIHGSNANHSSAPRTGFIIRYTTPAILRSRAPLVVANGRNDATHVPIATVPPPPDFDRSVAAYRAR
jgi:ectoine hydroxylase-related dioxygenase (phytanoyl-CoA dioxygenase family)